MLGVELGCCAAVLGQLGRFPGLGGCAVAIVLYRVLIVALCLVAELGFWEGLLTVAGWIAAECHGGLGRRG